MTSAVFVAAREAALERLIAFARADERVRAIWLQGSLADGSSDPLSDIDAYLAIEDSAFDAVFGARKAILEQVAPILAWSNATTPALTAVHALLDGPVKLDLFFEKVSETAKVKRPAARILLDKDGLAATLDLSWEAPRAQIGAILGMMIRMQRQGALWPIRLLLRGQFSTYAMTAIDLVNRELALLMALQNDPRHYFTNQFSMSRALFDAQRDEIDQLTRDILAALHAKDPATLRDLHLRTYDALLREGRAACAALAIPYPIGDQGDERIRELLWRNWPLD